MIRQITFLLIGIALIEKIHAQSAEEHKLRDLNPSLFEQDFREYNQATAIYCAQLSDLVYLSAKGIDAFFEKICQRYPDAQLKYKFISDRKSNTQALLLYSKNFLVIAVRGTQIRVMKDWWENSKYFNYENTDSSNERLANMQPGHGGFRKGVMRLIRDKNLFEEIDEIIEKKADSSDVSSFPIYLTGHSLGAALSQVLIEPLNYRKYYFAGAYHFAPPLAVSCDVNEYMRDTYGDRVYDIVNFKYYVPRAGRNHVAHFGKFYRICDDKKIYREKEAFVRFGFWERLVEFKLHSLTNHISLLKRPENNGREINERSAGNDYGCMELEEEAGICID